MPHYKDGTPAKIGDFVRGNGYNQTKDSGCIGIVTRVIVADSCNLTVKIPTLASVAPIDRPFIPVEIEVEPGQIKRSYLFIETEYGATKDFEKL